MEVSWKEAKPIWAEFRFATVVTMCSVSCHHPAAEIYRSFDHGSHCSPSITQEDPIIRSLSSSCLWVICKFLLLQIMSNLKTVSSHSSRASGHHYSTNREIVTQGTAHCDTFCLPFTGLVAVHDIVSIWWLAVYHPLVMNLRSALGWDFTFDHCSESWCRVFSARCWHSTSIYMAIGPTHF